MRRLNERAPLVWSIAIVYVTIGLIGALALLLIVPPLIDESQKLVVQLPGFVAKASAELQNPHNKLLLRVPPGSRRYLAELPAQLGTLIQTYAFDAAQKTFTLLLSAVTVLGTLIIVPVLAAYMLLDATNVKRQVLGLFPPKHRAQTDRIIDDLDGVVGGFIRGQLIDGAICRHDDWDDARNHARAVCVAHRHCSGNS